MNVKLKYDGIDYDHFDDVELELDYIVDLLFWSGYDMTPFHAYCAWLAGGDGVWEHPFDYSDDYVVREILATCGIEPQMETEFVAPLPYPDETLEDWDLVELERELDLYEAKQNAKVEGSDEYYPNPFVEKKYN
jgi:hypothetical protein